METRKPQDLHVWENNPRPSDEDTGAVDADLREDLLRGYDPAYPFIVEKDGNTIQGNRRLTLILAMDNDEREKCLAAFGGEIPVIVQDFADDDARFVVAFSEGDNSKHRKPLWALACWVVTMMQARLWSYTKMIDYLTAHARAVLNRLSPAAVSETDRKKLQTRAKGKFQNLEDVSKFCPALFDAWKAEQQNPPKRGERRFTTGGNGTIKQLAAIRDASAQEAEYKAICKQQDRERDTETPSNVLTAKNVDKIFSQLVNPTVKALCALIVKPNTDDAKTRNAVEMLKEIDRQQTVADRAATDGAARLAALEKAQPEPATASRRTGRGKKGRKK